MSTAIISVNLYQQRADKVADITAKWGDRYVGLVVELHKRIFIQTINYRNIVDGVPITKRH